MDLTRSGKVLSSSFVALLSLLVVYHHLTKLMTTSHRIFPPVNKAYSRYYRSYSDGSSQRSESGTPNPEGGHTATGVFSYVGPDGQNYEVEYRAGLEGFEARGAHLPPPPPLPPALQRWEDAKNGRLRKGKTFREKRQSRRISFKTPLITKGGRIQFRKN